METDIVNSGNNYELLKKKYGEKMGWTSLSADELQNDWRNSKSFVMLQLCRDMRQGELENFTMPKHIQSVLDFLETGVSDIEH